MMIRYFELAGTLYRRLDTGFHLSAERLDPGTKRWVTDPAFIHELAEGTFGVVAIDDARAAEIAASLGLSLELPPQASAARKGA